jgi:hypothetical protein
MMKMPEDERDGLYDPEEEYPWDQDNAYDLDDDRLDGDEDDEDEDS